jgi:membrane-associated phospholipid phosphatase
MFGSAVAPGTLALASSEATLTQSGSVKSGDRVEQAYEMRVHAALLQKHLPFATQRTNGDEERYPSRIASYTKSLPHADNGEVDPDAYHAFIRALQSGTRAELEALPLGGVMRLANPQAGLGFGLEGGDSHYFAIAEPPKFASAEQAGEMAELYWQSLTRDVPFAQYDADPLIGRAVTDLTRLSDFRGPRTEGGITPKTLFRGNTPGDLNGPYVSQFLWQDVPYGATRIIQRIRTVIPGINYLTSFSHWLEAQNGAHPMTANRPEGTPRYIRNNRDLGRYIQVDFTYQAFLNACLILLGTNASLDPANPYKASPTQSGFCTFGAPHALDLLAKVANYGLKAAWYQKWYVHRRLRPEEFGGAVHKVRKRIADYPIHTDILNSSALETVFNATGTYLLPQAYPEGCPTHPSYPSGHAVVAGACATVLKAFFDESFQIRRPVEAVADGLSVAPYRGAELYVGDELNKLAANVAMGRNAAGIHWRSDAIDGLTLGQEVAISLLKEERGCLNEAFDGFTLTKFDGKQVVL